MPIYCHLGEYRKAILAAVPEPIYPDPSKEPVPEPIFMEVVEKNTHKSI